MPISPTGPVSLPLENLRILLAGCPGFRTWVGAANATEARTRILLVEMTAPADPQGYTAAELAAMRPFAVIDEHQLEDDRPGGDAWVWDRVGLPAFVASQAGGREVNVHLYPAPDE